jgi:hypothetical protein
MKNRRTGEKSGAVMVFAVVLLTAGVFVLAAVMQLAATQGISGEAEWDALQRRVTLGNSRAMAREYMLSRIFRGSVPANPNSSSVSFSGDSGGFVIQPAGSAQTNYWSALSTTNTDVVLNINPFNLMERGGFYREVFMASLSQGDDTVDWSFALRTRSPIAAGYSFVQHRPADNDLASLAVPPYIDMNGTGEQFYGYYGLPRMPVSSVTNTMTRVTGDANGYQGYLDAPEGASAYGFFTNVTYVPREPTNQTPQTLQAVLDLSAEDPNVPVSVLRFNVTDNAVSYANGTNPPSNLPVKAVVLRGTDIYDRKPLHVVVPEANTNVTGLVLSNNNTRLVYFYREKASNDGVPFDVSSINADSWRLGITMSRCNIQFDIGSLEIVGGLRTDGSITFQGGSANFVPETDPGGLDFIADRMMWLEDYRAQQ